MEHSQIRYEVDGGIGLATLYRPEALNAFTPVMEAELVSVFREADQDDAVRVVVVTGAGKAFCAGADLSSGETAFDFLRQDGREVSISEHRDSGGRLALAIFQCRKPVIAAINGHAVGIGITMTLPMDIRIAAEEAKIGFVFVRRGIVPDASSTWFLPHIVGVGKATELMYTGRIFRAKEEAHSGLFNEVLPGDQVLARAMTIAREIAENAAPVSVALTKALIWHGLSEPDPHSVHLIDSKCIYWTGREKDAREGVQSFLEKRAPTFSLRPSRDMPPFYPWWKEPKV
jgi:enoyl-CoA hydratase/carnithine racemase